MSKVSVPNAGRGFRTGSSSKLHAFWTLPTPRISLLDRNHPSIMQAFTLAAWEKHHEANSWHVLGCQCDLHSRVLSQIVIVLIATTGLFRFPSWFSLLTWL